MTLTVKGLNFNVPMKILLTQNVKCSKSETTKKHSLIIELYLKTYFAMLKQLHGFRGRHQRQSSELTVNVNLNYTDIRAM